VIRRLGEGKKTKRVCVTRGKTMQKSKSGIVLNSNHSMESKVVLAIYVNQIGLVNAYACVCACACVF
jgi:co-chaperonin GroES (HSP10)